MITLRFLGCKGDTTLEKSNDCQADSALCIEDSVNKLKILINCGEDWADKMSIVNPDAIILTSPAPEHAYGIMKCDKQLIHAANSTHNKLQSLFNYEPLYKKDKLDVDFTENISIKQIGKSVMLSIYGKNILYAPEFCPEDMDGLKQADILIGNGYSLKDNIVSKSINGERKYVSMVNQVNLCRKYDVRTAIFTSFGEECVKIGRTLLYKAISKLTNTDSVDVILAYHGYEMGVDVSEETLSVKQAFGSPGGKKFMLQHLMKYIPEHQTYVESFVGGGSLFWKKDPSGKEVINDKDPEIYFLYKYLQTCSDEDIELLKRFNWTSTKTQFEKLKNEEKLFVEKGDYTFSSDPPFDCECIECGHKVQSGGHCKDTPCPKCGGTMRREDRPGIGQPAENNNKLTPGQNESKDKRFYRLMYLKRFSDVGFMKVYNKMTEGKTHTICDRITPVRERLSNTIIENESYDVVIPKHDGPDVWHFIDPPYPNAKYPWKYQISTGELNQVLKNIKGKFLLTYETEAKNEFPGFYQRFIKLRSQANPWRGVVNKTELLVANYKFDARSKIK